MSKKRQINLQLDDHIISEASLPETENTRFHLFRKERELMEIDQVLNQLSTKDKSEALDWIQDNDDLVISLADSFIDESINSLEGSALDNETMQLSLKVMSGLKKTLGRFESLVSDSDGFIEDRGDLEA